jgi:hypothetical protein
MKPISALTKEYPMKNFSIARVSPSEFSESFYLAIVTDDAMEHTIGKIKDSLEVFKLKLRPTGVVLEDFPGVSTSCHEKLDDAVSALVNLIVGKDVVVAAIDYSWQPYEDFLFNGQVWWQSTNKYSDERAVACLSDSQDLYSVLYGEHLDSVLILDNVQAGIDFVIKRTNEGKADDDSLATLTELKHQLNTFWLKKYTITTANYGAIEVDSLHEDSVFDVVMEHHPDAQILDEGIIQSKDWLVVSFKDKAKGVDRLSVASLYESIKDSNDYKSAIDSSFNDKVEECIKDCVDQGRISYSLDSLLDTIYIVVKLESGRTCVFHDLHVF